jgi:ectoine hydroxylase-related dioxygenase (phytanoyl-CoA dioxygenase family)
MLDRATKGQIEEGYRRDGFAVVPQLADPDTLAAFREIYDGMLDGTIPCPGTDRELGGLTRQIMMPHLHHPLFAQNPALDVARDLARDLTGVQDPQFLFSMLIYKPAGHPHDTPWHQDVSYSGRPFTPAGTKWPFDVICQFWLALDDVDETMGCMEFIPGEHLKPMHPHVVASGDPDDEGRLLAIEAPELELPLQTAVRCPLPAGSATVHGYTTPHYTGPNSGTRGRRAYIFSFADMARLQELSARLRAA